MDSTLDEFGRLMFIQSRIPALDALEVFVPEGSERDDAVRDLTSRTGASRWFPVAGGHRVLILYEGGEYDPQRFSLRKGAWDHDHCRRCQRQIRSMTLCWVTTEGPYVVLCEDCYRPI